MQRHAAGHALTGSGIEGLLDDGQMLGQPGGAFVLGGWTRRGRFGLQRRPGWCLRFGCRLVLHTLQEQLQLDRVELLALAAEEPAHQRIDLLAQERVLTLQTLVGFQQLGFAGSLAQGERDIRSKVIFEDRTFCINLTPVRTTDAAAPRAVRCRR